MAPTRIKKWIAKGDVQRAKIAACVAFVVTLGGVIVIRCVTLRITELSADSRSPSNVLVASASSWGTLFNSDPGEYGGGATSFPDH